MRGLVIVLVIVAALVAAVLIARAVAGRSQAQHTESQARAVSAAPRAGSVAAYSDGRKVQIVLADPDHEVSEPFETLDISDFPDPVSRDHTAYMEAMGQARAVAAEYNSELDANDATTGGGK